MMRRRGRRLVTAIMTTTEQLETHREALVGHCYRMLGSAAEADKAEVDRPWDALSAGGVVEQCRWLRDRYGVSWQIEPTVLGEMMTDPDRSRVKRVRRRCSA